jgi:predicted nucleic acid-binding protein
MGEAANTVLQRFRRGDLTADEAETAVHDILDLAIVVTLPPGLIEEGFRFARDHELPTVYDSYYVVLARVLNAELWTDDRRLLRAIRNTAPWVRWIGEYPHPARPA